jgi:hypothetical protein
VFAYWLRMPKSYRVDRVDRQSYHGSKQSIRLARQYSSSSTKPRHSSQGNTPYMHLSDRT